MRFPTKPAKAQIRDCAYAHSDQSHFSSLEYSMIIKLLAEHHMASISLKSVCTGWSESTHVKIPHCWKSHVAAQTCVGVANREDQILIRQSSLIWVCAVCLGLFDRQLVFEILEHLLYQQKTAIFIQQ